MVQDSPSISQQILDKWAVIIIPKEAIYKNKDKQPQINQNKTRYYTETGFKGDEVLWVAPKDCIRIEFEDDPAKNARYIAELESSAKSLGFDYCITGHNGKSDYFNMFGVKGLPLGEDNKQAKLILIDLLLPAAAKDQLDRTNLGWTLSPIIGHPHWKPKYGGSVHKLLRGTNPLEQKNEYPKELHKQLKKAKTWHKNYSNKLKYNDKWLEDFFINYCCNNELPKGSRHFVIEKNLAAFLMFRKDKDEIKQKYYDAQSRRTDTMRTWEAAILRGDYTNISAGEIAKFIKEHKLEFTIPKPQILTEKSVERAKSTTNQILQFLASHQRATATEHLAQDLLINEHIYTTRHDEKSEMWIYRDGIYIPQAKTFVKEYCREVLQEAYTIGITNEVISKIEAETFIDDDDFFINENLDLIAVKNGVLNLKTLDIKGFTPKYKFFNKLPINYIPGAECPAIVQFFKDVLHEDDIDVMQELFGYTLYRDYKIEKAFMFTGYGRNGKGKTLELLKRFVGPDNCSNIPLQSLESDNFAMAELHNKLANLSADISASALKNTGNFKSLTGHDMLSASRKYLNRIHFVNYAKMIFCANQLPISYDLTTAFFNRWVLIDFKYTFLSKQEIDKMPNEDKTFVKEADREIIDKISTEAELTGLLNWALEGLNRLFQQKDFSYTSTTKDVKNQWMRKSDSVNAFLMDIIEVDYSREMLKSEFRRIYTAYCHKYKLKLSNDKHIKHTLETTLGVSDQYTRVGDRQQWSWQNICFRNGVLEEFEKEEELSRQRKAEEIERKKSKLGEYNGS